jgi:hypothetical protein
MLGCGDRRSACALRGALACALASGAALFGATAFAALRDPIAQSVIWDVRLGTTKADKESGQNARMFGGSVGGGVVLRGVEVAATGGGVRDRVIVPADLARRLRAVGMFAEARSGFRPFQTANQQANPGARAFAVTAVTSWQGLTRGSGQVAAVTGSAMTGNAQLPGSGTMTGLLPGGATSGVGASGSTRSSGDNNGAGGLSVGGTLDIAGGAPDSTIIATPHGTVRGTAELGAPLTLTGELRGAGRS